MDIERLVMEHKKEKDRNVADRILLIILIQRDNMYITKAATPPQQVQVVGSQVESSLSGEWNSWTAGQTQIRQATKGLQGHHEKDTKADSKDCLLGGRICTEFHK